MGGGQLAQPHPSCAPLAEDADGMLPEWIVYHEMVATTKTFLRQVGARGARMRAHRGGCLRSGCGRGAACQAACQPARHARCAPRATSS